MSKRKGGRAVDGTGLENRNGVTSVVGSNPTPSAITITAEMQRQFRNLHWEISELKKKAGVALDLQRKAEKQSHDNKLRARTAENSLKVLEQDAHRFRWLKTLTCEEAVDLLKRWETDQWDHILDKARGHIR
jgi:hypothetical protein